ncbi:hypothetical protein [Solicola gregarius]|uniref:Uncharacterized protein n=1 Tax=Solicola gregarius TaxID=2908642 RepID=A0AA46TI32_9ACTN|nr:hypothetical protein [Solicola gregarius]UYM05586.1 hypothetical protein L0C25_00415 [Solicola gregarius]
MPSVHLRLVTALAATALAASLTAPASATAGEASVRRAVPGTYKMKPSKGQLSFKVTRKGTYMKHWKALLLTRCGGYPSPITYQWLWYDFPTTKIKRSGWVRRTWKKDDFRMKLRVKFVGKRAKRGYTAYSGPGQCVAVRKWTARRVGK